MPLTDFELHIISGNETLEWSFTDMVSNTSGPKYCDEDNDNQISEGDYLFIPKSFMNAALYINIYHIPSEINADTYY